MGNCFFIGLLASALLLSCESAGKRSEKAYFDFDSLINAQVRYLAAHAPKLTKQAVVDGRTEELETTPADSAAWSKELDIFRQLDLINKPINRDSYEIKEGLSDTKSNLLVSEYKATEDLALAYLKIYYQDTPGNVRRIEGTYREKNALYTGTRFLTMELTTIQTHVVLTSYSISGGQKMILGDSVQFKILGTITYTD